MSGDRNVVRRAVPFLGSVLAVVSLTQPYATITGQVTGETVFRDLVVSVPNVLDVVFGGLPPVLGLVYIAVTGVLLTMVVMVPSGVLLSLKSRYAGGYVLLGTWFTFWVAAVGAVNIVSVPGVSQLNVQFASGFYLLLIGSLLVFGDYTVDEIRGSPRSEYLSLAGSALAYGSLFFPYFHVRGSLFDIQIDMGFTLIGLAFTLPGGNLFAILLVSGFIFLGGFLAMTPGLMYPGNIRFKSRTYPVVGAVAVAAGLGVTLFVNRAIESVGLTTSFGTGFYVAIASIAVLLGAGITRSLS